MSASEDVAMARSKNEFEVAFSNTPGINVDSGSLWRSPSPPRRYCSSAVKSFIQDLEALAK
jgi:hypothetical protein